MKKIKSKKNQAANFLSDMNQKLTLVDLIILIYLIFLGTFLRTFRLEDNLVFHGELGQNYLAVRDAVSDRRLPLVGPPTSHSWLYFGPLYYWLMIPTLLIGSYNPTSGAWLMVLLGSLALVLNYEVIFKIFGKKTALLSTFFMAISPLWLSYIRQSRFYFLTALFFYPLLYLIDKILNDYSISEKLPYTKLIFVGLTLGAMLNFHYSSLALLPAVLILLYPYMRKSMVKIAIYILFGIFIPFIPWLLQISIDKILMLSKLLVWVPYRIGGFFGIFPENHFSLKSLMDTVSLVGRFFISSFTPYDLNKNLGIIVGVLIILAMSTYVFFSFKKHNQKNPLHLITLLGLTLIFSLLIHGFPPDHYLVAILPLPIIIASRLLNRLINHPSGKLIISALIIMILVTNLAWYFSPQWFFSDQREVSQNGRVPFKLQLNLAQTIIYSAAGRSYSLARVGKDDNFSVFFAQNYHYLLWWLGNEPKSGQNLLYTFIEDQDRIPNYYQSDEKLYRVSNAAVIMESLAE